VTYLGYGRHDQGMAGMAPGMGATLTGSQNLLGKKWKFLFTISWASILRPA